MYKKVTFDLDERCRLLMGELDRANNNPNERMESGFLSGTTQEFLTPHLRTALERELNKVLREQVRPHSCI